MKEKKGILLLLAIVILALVLRMYKLGGNPPSLDWDEASIGFNAYSILKTAKDEYGKFLPISFRSFGDYKPPAYIYMTVPAVAYFDLTEFAVRLPSAVFGSLAVLATYFLVRELFGLSDDLPMSRQKIALVAALFLAISPWHLQFSRTAFEANLGLFFTILGVWLFLKGLRQSTYLILSALAFVLTIYSYHSSRLITPLLVLGLCLYFHKVLLRHKIASLVSAVVGAVLVFPLVINVFTSKEVFARFAAVVHPIASEQQRDLNNFLDTDSLRHDPLGKLFHDRRVLTVISLVGAYGDHFNLSYLFLKGDQYVRHNPSRMGLLFYWEMISVPIGLILTLELKQKRVRFIVFLWFLLAPLASAFTKGTPHAVRSLLYLPVYQLFSAIAVVWLWKQKFRHNSIVLRTFTLVMIVFNFLYYLDVYHIHTPIETSKSWQYGYKEAMEYLATEDTQVSKIIFTNRFDQPYIYYLFYNKIDPGWYQEIWRGAPPSQELRVIGKYEFRKVDWSFDDKQQNSFIVGSSGEGGEVPPDAHGIVKEIHFLDGSVAFRIARR